MAVNEVNQYRCLLDAMLIARRTLCQLDKTAATAVAKSLSDFGKNHPLGKSNLLSPLTM